METLEKAKDLLLVLGIDADAVVAYGKDPVSILALGCDMHFRRPFWTAIFDCVADEILEQLLQMCPVHRK
jgi:hypothetical protein